MQLNQSSDLFLVQLCVIMCNVNDFLYQLWLLSYFHMTCLQVRSLHSQIHSGFGEQVSQQIFYEQQTIKRLTKLSNTFVSFDSEVRRNYQNNVHNTYKNWRAFDPKPFKNYYKNLLRKKRGISFNKILT